MHIDNVSGEITFRPKITRTQLVEMADDLFQKCLLPVKTALETAQRKPSEVTQVVLVGGSSAIPRVRELLEAHFGGLKPYAGVDPRTAVVQGAALLASKLSGNAELQGLELCDVCPLTIGISVRKGIMWPIIARGSRLPIHRVTHRLVTGQYDQATMPVKIYEGERKMVRNNHLLGTYEVRNVPKGEAGSQAMELTFSITDDGILTAAAVVVSEQRRMEVPISKNPWHYTISELNDLVRVDPATEQQDDEEADRAGRTFKRDNLIRNIGKYFGDQEQSNGLFAQQTTKEDHAAVQQETEHLNPV
jgi:molecular chaperone DnaK (HSP70)